MKAEGIIQENRKKDPGVRKLNLEQRLKDERILRKLTQQDIADAIGLTPQAVSAMERRNVGTGFVAYLTYLREIGVDLNDLFTNEV